MASPLPCEERWQSALVNYGLERPSENTEIHVFRVILQTSLDKKACTRSVTSAGPMSDPIQTLELFFFCLMAAWLNEGRCPGGRPSVSTNYITIEASVFCIEMTTVHAIYEHRIKLAVSQRVPFG